MRRDWIAAKAIEDYVALNAWQLARIKEGIADADLMRKARVETQVTRIGAGNRVEDQTGDNDPDPAGRNEP